MNLLSLVLSAAALLIALRIVLGLWRARRRSPGDWDERLVRNLRAAGGHAFTPYEVDFFFNVPDEAACAALRGALEPEGFTVHARAMGGEGASGFSLHARKRLLISVSQMQEYSARFRALAGQYDGHYDGWTADTGQR
jgi:hypothetical protein